MATPKTMTLDQAYEYVAEKGRVVPSVFARISMLEDFSSPDPRYCTTVCQIPGACKKPSNATLLKVPDKEKNGIVILFAVKPKSWRDTQHQNSIVDYLMKTTCRGIPYHIVYATRCAPEFGAKKDFSITQMKACKNFLVKDIDELQPKVVITTSTMAAKSIGLVGIGQKTHLSRFMFPFSNPDVSVVMTLNPLATTMIRQNASGAYWGNDFFHLIRHDFFKAGRLWKGEITNKDTRSEVDSLKQQGRLKVTRSLIEVSEAMQFLQNLPVNSVISWDTETTGLDPWAEDARFLSHQFGFTFEGQTYAVVIPLWHRDNDCYDANEAWPFIVAVLENPNLTKVGHNGKFDLKYTRVTTGVEVASYSFDTMYAVHSICSGLQGSGTYTLKKAVWDIIPESGLGGYDDLLAVEEVIEDEESDE